MTMPQPPPGASQGNLTIFLTEASGDQGEVCGLCNPEHRVLEVHVNMLVSE